MFTKRTDAESAIRELKAAGFSEDRIGVALQDPDEQRDLLETTGSDGGRGAAAGALSGGLVGGLIGLLGSLLIPGVGPIVVGGVLASTLTGAGVGAATGGIIGALVGLGVPEADARALRRGLRCGRTLVTVDAGARTAEALAILDRHGMDFGPSGAARQSHGHRDRRGPGRRCRPGADRRDRRRHAGTPSGTRPPRLRSANECQPAESITGRERRPTQDASYAGPERRLVGV